MKHLTLIVALMAVAGFALISIAADEPAKPTTVGGKVVSVDAAAGKLVVAGRDGKEVTVTTDANTKITVDGKEGKIADIKADMMVRATVPATGAATEIRAFAARTSSSTSAPAGVRGKVVSVDAATGKIVISTRGGDQVTVATDASTKFTVDGKEAKIGDIKADMRLNATPATGTATEVKATSPRTNG